MNVQELRARGGWLYRVRTRAGLRTWRSAERLDQAAREAYVAAQGWEPLGKVRWRRLTPADLALLAPGPALAPILRRAPLWRHERPDVTVGIRTTGQRPWGLAAAIASALAQGGVRVEVLVISDGAGAIAHTSYSVSVVEVLKRRGPAHGWRMLVEHGRGTYLRMLDDDDELPPGALAAQVAAVRRRGVVAAFGELLDLDTGKPYPEDGWTGLRARRGAEECTPQQIIDDEWSLVPMPAGLWRRTSLVAPPEDFATSDDNAAVRLSLATHGGRVDPLPGVQVLCYKRAAGSNSGVGRRGPVDAWRQRMCLHRVESARYLAWSEQLAQRAERPLRMAFLSWAWDTGGATWRCQQTAAHYDPRLIEPHFIAMREDDCDAACPGPLHIRPAGSAATIDEWAAEVCREQKIDLLATPWAAFWVGDATAAAVPVRVAYCQGEVLESTRLYEPEVHARFHGAICSTQRVRDAAPFLSGLETTVIHSPADTVALARPIDRAALRAQLGVGDDELLMMASGRLIAEGKRWGDTLAVARAARRRGLPVRLVVLGSTRQGADYASWHRLAEGEEIVWIDGLRPWDAAVLYRAGDVYLSTSAHEGMSLALVEAMAAGCVPVVTRVSGTAELVCEGVTGYSAEVGDVAGLVVGVEQCRDAGARSALAEQARHTARCLCDVRDIARREQVWLWRLWERVWRDAVVAAKRRGRAR